MPENQNSELDATELIGLVEGTVAELKDYVRENDFSDEQLEQIINAESASKDRKTAKKFLRNQMDKEEKSTSGKEKASSKEIEKQVENVDAKETSLSREALLQMLGGTVEDVKKYVKENNPDDSELQSLLHAEKMVKDRKTVVRFLKSYSKKKELEEDFHEAETDLEQLKEDLKTIEETVLEEDVELDLDNIPEPPVDEESEDNTEDGGQSEKESEEAESGEKEPEEEGSDEEDTSEEEDSGENSEDEESQTEPENDENEEDTENEDSEEESEETDGDEEKSGESEDVEEDELTEMEKKKQLLEDLEMDLSEEELEQISLEELEKLREEKQKREELINRLSVKFDREQLEKVTTKDLEKLAEEVGGIDSISEQDVQSQEAEAKKQKEKDEEEMKKEAQHDLEMMMGAVKNSEEEDEESGPSAVEQIKQLPDKFKGVFSRGGDDEEEESAGFDKSKTIEVLEGYREAEDREAAVKTAQVMKGYLEYALGIEREMTYAELAEEMESREMENENIDTLIKFYRSMKISVYTGNVETENIDEVIDAAEATVKELG